MNVTLFGKKAADIHSEDEIALVTTEEERERQRRQCRRGGRDPRDVLPNEPKKPPDATSDKGRFSP